MRSRLVGWTRGRNGRERLTKRADAVRVEGEEEDLNWYGRTVRREILRT